MTTEKILTKIAVPIAVALIALWGVWLTVTHKSSDAQAKSSVEQKNDSGTIKAAGRDFYDAGSYNIHPNGPVNIFLDTSKHTQPPPSSGSGNNTSKHTPATKSGSSGNSSVNVTSINQHGGLTVGQIFVLNNATFIKSDKNESLGNVAKNFTCTLDKRTQRITFQPKTGEWSNPFIAFPYSAFANVDPHFANINHIQINVDTASYGINGDNLFGLSTLTKSASPSLGYYMHYSQMPTKIVFGNYPAPLYETVLYQDK